jgi:hypothetical protein
MKHLGRTLCELGDSQSADFAEFAACAALAHRCRLVAAVDGAHGDVPDYWQDALDTHRRSLIDSASDPGFYVPDELGGDSIEERRRRLQSFVGQFGNLLCVWPDVVAAARALSSDELFAHSVSSS